MLVEKSAEVLFERPMPVKSAPSDDADDRYASCETPSDVADVFEKSLITPAESPKTVLPADCASFRQGAGWLAIASPATIGVVTPAVITLPTLRKSDAMLLSLPAAFSSPLVIWSFKESRTLSSASVAI